MLPPASQHVLNLIPSADNIYINVSAPLLTIINPASALTLDNDYANFKPYQIEYDFGDGTPVFTQKLFATPLETDLDKPWPLEPGDPRNYPVEHLFTLKSAVSAYYKCSVKVSWVEDPLDAIGSLTYNIHIRLRPPSLRHLRYFKEIHLTSTRMFGPRDTVLYNFEGVEPSYSLPVLVDWGKFVKEQAPPARMNGGILNSSEIEEMLEYRPVKMLPPYYQKINE